MQFNIVLVSVAMVTSILQADCSTLLNKNLNQSDCEILTLECRDNNLANKLNKAFKEHKKWLDIYEINKSVLDDIQGLRNDGEWNKAQDHIARSISILSTLIGVSLSPLPINSSILRSALEGINYLPIVLAQDATKTIMLQQLGKGIISAQLVILNDLYVLKKADNEYEQVLTNLTNDINVQNQKVENYKSLLNTAVTSIEEINKEKNRIDILCN